MEHSDLQRFTANVFERMNVRYFITGSTATIFYGEPRFTNDLDVVADLRLEHVPEFLAAFDPDEFYLSEDAVRGAINQKGQFNIIHPASGLKVDVMIPTPHGFDQERLQRAVRLQIEPDFSAVFTTPEDIIVKKMDFYREGGSEKHLRDITGVLKTLGSEIDREFIAREANRMGLADVWIAILKRLG